MESLLNALKAVAEPSRLRILALCQDAELTVSELVKILGQSQPRVSRHLKLLVEAGVLERFQEGSWVFHRATRDGVGAQLGDAVANLIPARDHHMIRDRERLAEVTRLRAKAAAAYFRDNAQAWDRLRALHIDEAEVERTILEMLPKQKIDDLLDIGTGTGRVLELLAQRVTRGLGIDASHEMLNVARAKLERSDADHCRVRQTDMYQMPFPAAAFDAAVIHQVLHFVDDPAGVVGEAARVLQPGGHLLVVDFTPHGEESLRQDHAHRRLGFDDQEVAGWFSDAGLTMRETRHLAGEPLTVGVWLAEKRRGQRGLPIARAAAHPPSH